MKKIISILLAGLMTNPALAGVENRGVVNIPSKEESKATQRSKDIVEWKKVRVKAGYILSQDLYYQQHCSPTWDIHVKEFKKRNPQIKNPNRISEGSLIEVQTCRSDSDSVIVQDKQNNKPKEEVAIQKEEIKTESFHEKNWPLDTIYLDVYAGLITEEKHRDTSFLGGVGAHGDLYDFLGYDVRVLASDIVALTKAEVRFKTKPDFQRYVLIYGLGNRIGLQNSDLDRLDTGVDSYSYLGLGVEIYRSEKSRFQFDLTHNIAQESGINGSVTAQKRIYGDNWLGVFIEYNSTKSTVDNRPGDRRYLGGGLKFSF